MPSDLLLLAVRYISDELPVDEAMAFETLLAHDQSAREAVAEAVELRLAVSSLPASSPERLPMSAKRRTFEPIRLAMAAACVASVIGLVLGVPRRAPEPSVVHAVGHAEHPEEIALAWSGLRQSGEVDLVSHTELLAWLDEPMAGASAELQPGGSTQVEDELLPRWLLEATSLPEVSGSSAAGAREN